MKERKESAAESAARLLNQLTAAEREELQSWKDSARAGRASRNVSGRNSGTGGNRLQTGLNMMIIEKGNSVSYSATNISPEFTGVPPLVLSRPLKGFLITVAALAVISLVIIFYITIKTFKGHKYPVKSIQQRNYRFR